MFNKKKSIHNRPKAKTMNIMQRENIVRKPQEPVIIERPRNYSGRKVQLFNPRRAQTELTPVEETQNFDEFND